MSITSNVAAIGYALCTVLSLTFCVLLLTRWRGRLNGLLFFLFCFFTAIWSSVSVYAALIEFPHNLLMVISELMRNGIWAVFLIQLIYLQNPSQKKSPFFKIFTLLAYGIPLLLVILSIYQGANNGVLPWLGVLGYIGMAILGLFFVDQVYRSANIELRKILKYFCFGIGTIYLFDLYLYSDVLLFNQFDSQVWAARGFVYSFSLVLIGFTVIKNPVSESSVSVSRSIMFYSTAMVLTAFYLLIMAGGGYYLKQTGGEWGVILSVIFIFLSLMLLLILAFSNHVRASIRVFIDKHFLEYKYDYREQWLGLIRALTSADEIKLEARALRAILHVMNSPGGSLWVRKNQQHFTPIAQVGMSEAEGVLESTDGSLANYLENWQWVVNLEEYQSEPDIYQDLELPKWLKNQKDAWLVVPLMLQLKLYGYIVILRSKAKKDFNWEDIDLLRTAGRQVAIHLAEQRSAMALVQARQFEAFNRFSAYVVHDLKNLVSQLALVVKNAEKHQHNPEFMEDAINTVDNAVDRMNRLLAQLRSGKTDQESLEITDLNLVLNSVISEKSNGLPAPIYTNNLESLFVQANEVRLVSVIGHIVQNAQDATSENGKIQLQLEKNGNNALVTVTDTGCGMDQEFMNERLFKPFDTTKGLTGMGIGAHESKVFIEELGGSLDVESKKGKGSIFYISLPLFVPT